MKGVMPREQNSNHQISPSTPVVKVMTKGEGGQKSLKIDDVFYERPPTLNHVEPSLELMTSKLY